MIISEILARNARMYGDKTAGEHNVLWDGNDQSGIRAVPGIYLVYFQQDNISASSKILMNHR